MADESLKNYIETSRLILRNWHVDDAEALYTYASDGRVCELAMWPRHESVEIFKSSFSKHKEPEWTIVK